LFGVRERGVKRRDPALKRRAKFNRRYAPQQVSEFY
jgi:hypothetical protein